MSIQHLVAVLAGVATIVLSIIALAQGALEDLNLIAWAALSAGIGIVLAMVDLSPLWKKGGPPA
jgi:hypothetical protein